MRFSFLIAGLLLAACATAEPTLPPPTVTPTTPPVQLPVISTVGPPQSPIPPDAVSPTAPSATATAEPPPNPAPLATPTVRPTPQPSNEPVPEVHRDIDHEVAVGRAAMAYAYCNGLYFGSEAEQRHASVLTGMESGARPLTEVQDDVRNLCNSNFQNPRERLPPATATPVPTPTPDPREEDANAFERRQYLLELLNERRRDLGLPDFRSSFSAAAQIHADLSRNTCSASLWTPDGETIHHLYHREGGAQRLVVYHAGHTRCAPYPPERWPTWKQEAADVVSAIEPIPGNPLHDPDLRAAAIGAAWTPAQRWHTVILEEDRVNFDQDTFHTTGEPPAAIRIIPPEFDRGQARLTGSLPADVLPTNLIARIYHLPNSGPLTRNQAHAVPVHAPGNLVAVAVPARESLDLPIPTTQNGQNGAGAPGRPGPYVADTPDCFSSSPAPAHDHAPEPFVICRGAWTTPYDLPPETAPAADAGSAAGIHLGNQPGLPVQVRQTLARELRIIETAQGPNLLSVYLNTHSLRQFHGPGIYTLEIWGTIRGEVQLLAAGSHQDQP